MLGPFEVVADGRPLSLGGPRQRSLLAILLLRRGEVVPSDQLIDELWNERPPATAAKTLQGHVSHLRKLLGPNVLITRNGGYLVDVPPEQVDAERFAALVADARAARDPPAARELLGQALGLWRGAPLSDLAYEPFAQGAIARLEAAHLDALEDRLAADLALGRHRALIGELEGLVDAHPERERLLGALMLGLYRSGRQTEALAVYRRGREALQEELGLVPGPELRALERQILDHDPRLKVHETPASRARRRGLIATGVVVVLAAALTAGLAARGHATAIRVQPDSLVAIDATTNRVVGDVLVGARPSAVAAAAGSLWVGNLDEQTVSRVDRHRLRARAIPVGDSPTGIAAAGGRVWVVRSPSGRPLGVRHVDRPTVQPLGPPCPGPRRGARRRGCDRRPRLHGVRRPRIRSAGDAGRERPDRRQTRSRRRCDGHRDRPRRCGVDDRQ